MSPFSQLHQVVGEGATLTTGLNLKVNVIASLEFELTSYDTEVEHVSHYVTRVTFC